MTLCILISLLMGCTTSSPTPERTEEPNISTVKPTDAMRIQAKKTASFDQTRLQNIQHKKQLYDSTPVVAQNLLPLLSAHHTKDLPSKKILDQQAQAEQGLLWITQSEHNIGIRSRAIQLLQFYDSPDTTQLLISIAQKNDASYLLRAAALQSISHWPLEKRAALLDILSQALDAENPVVVVSAIQASSSIDGLSKKITQLQQAHPSALVRGTIQQ